MSPTVRVGVALAAALLLAAGAHAKDCVHTDVTLPPRVASIRPECRTLELRVRETDSSFDIAPAGLGAAAGAAAALVPLIHPYPTPLEFPARSCDRRASVHRNGRRRVLPGEFLVWWTRSASRAQLLTIGLRAVPIPQNRLFLEPHRWHPRHLFEQP